MACRDLTLVLTGEEQNSSDASLNETGQEGSMKAAPAEMEVARWASGASHDISDNEGR